MENGEEYINALDQAINDEETKRQLALIMSRLGM